MKNVKTDDGLRLINNLQILRVQHLLCDFYVDAFEFNRHTPSVCLLNMKWRGNTFKRFTFNLNLIYLELIKPFTKSALRKTTNIQNDNYSSIATEIHIDFIKNIELTNSSLNLMGEKWPRFVDVFGGLFFVVCDIF